MHMHKHTYMHAHTYTPLQKHADIHMLAYMNACTHTYIYILCANTNKNVVRNLERSKKFTWPDVYPEEINKYVGLLLYMGVMDLPKVRDNFPALPGHCSDQQLHFTQRHACTHAHTLIYTHTRTCTYTHTQIYRLHIITHKCMHIHTHSHTHYILYKIHTHTYACTLTFTHIQIYTYTHSNTQTYR